MFTKFGGRFTLHSRHAEINERKRTIVVYAEMCDRKKNWILFSQLIIRGARGHR